MGNGLAGTVGWNAAGGALGNWIDDKEPLSGAITNGVGASIGYGIGKGLSWGTNAGANWWKGGWDPKFNSTLQKYTEIKGDFGISKEMTPSNPEAKAMAHVVVGRHPHLYPRKGLDMGRG